MVALLTAASLLAGAAIADYGGKVRHPEFRRRGDLKGARTMVAPRCTRLVCTRPDFDGCPRTLSELAVKQDLS